MMNNFIDCYFAVQKEQIEDYWMLACDNVNINSKLLVEFEDTSGRCGFPPSEHFPKQAKKPDTPRETPPFRDGLDVFDKVPNGTDANMSGRDWTQYMSGFNRVCIIHARVPLWLHDRAKNMPEYIGTTRQDVLDAFPDLDGYKTIEYADPDTGETVTREEPLLMKHEWR